MSMSPRSHQDKEHYFVDRMEGKVARLAIEKDAEHRFQINNIAYNSDMPFQAGVMKSGSESFKMESAVLTVAGTKVALNGLESQNTLKVADRVSGTSEAKLASLEVNGKTYQNIRLNSTADKLDKAALQQLADLLMRQTHSCVSETELMKEGEGILIALAQKGLNLESKGNQVELDGSKATFDGSLSLPENQYGKDELMQKLPEIVKYQMKLAVDKAFLEKSGLMGGEDAPFSDEDVAELAGQLPPPLKLEIQGEQLVLSAQQQ